MPKTFSPFVFFEATVPEGLESIVESELHTRLGGQERILQLEKPRPGLVQFTYAGKLSLLLQLKTVVSLFAGARFDVPRPRALMGDQTSRWLMQRVSEIMGLSPKASYSTLYLAAAGSDSSVMQRFAEEVAQQNGLTVTKNEGDLLVRVRRPLDGVHMEGSAPSNGWEVLIRMTPRPLTMRKWRVRDYPSALNAAVAAAMVSISGPRAGDCFLNLTCGSGTILIERAAHGAAKQLIGCDTNTEAIAIAKANLRAGGYEDRIQVNAWDARELPLEDASVDVICADLPIGYDEASHDENLIVYPKILKEAARVAMPKARAVFLTEELRMMDLLLNVSRDWALEMIYPITLNGEHPRIYVLRKM